MESEKLPQVVSLEPVGAEDHTFENEENLGVWS